VFCPRTDGAFSGEHGPSRQPIAAATGLIPVSQSYPAGTNGQARRVKEPFRIGFVAPARSGFR
jgi:hypothetical protein